MGKREVHNARVTRNTDVDLGVSLRGAVFFEAPSLFDGEYPIPALPCYPFASASGAGFFVVPKVGDEIEVEITSEDRSDPYDTTDIELPEPRWRCMIYNDATEIFSEFQKNYPFRMGWISNSGHQFIFDDFEGEELVRLAHTVGTFLEMDATGDYTEEVQRNKIAQIFGNKASTIQKDKTETIGGNHNIEVRKDRNELVKGSVNSQVLGDFDLAVQNNANWSFNEMIQTLGSLTQTITGAFERRVDGGYKDIIGGSYTRAVLANDNHTISGKQNILVAQEHEATYGVGSKETIVTIGKIFEIIAGNFEVNVAAGNITYAALAGLLEYGNALAKLAIGVAGDISISNLIGNVGIDAAGNVAVDGPTVVVNSGVGPVLTQVTAPVIDNITGAPQLGVPTFLA